jgi:aminopeptidase YwaD
MRHRDRLYPGDDDPFVAAAHVRSMRTTMTSLWSDFEMLCDLGGRLAGTESERRALAFLAERGAEATGVAPQRIPVAYEGWRATASRLLLLGPEDGMELSCHPLVRSIATPQEGLLAEVIDLGRGTEEVFQAHTGEIAGRIVLVRHEYMFADGTIHRRRKYEWARERGAVGFLIAAPPGNAVVAGSSGRRSGPGIPALGITHDVASFLAGQQVYMVIAAEEAPGATETLLFDVPGETDGWVVLSAHVDGHDLAESAMDNASGLAVALEVARRLAPEMKRMRRGLRLAFFSVEEWALIGSERYVSGLSETERQRVALNVNLDSVGGSARFTALTSGFPGLDVFLHETVPGLRTFRPLMANSDHFNFARGGIPALRLVAGFDEPQSNLRHVLTPADTRDKVAPEELAAASRITETIVRTVCALPDAAAHRLRDTQIVPTIYAESSL